MVYKCFAETSSGAITLGGVLKVNLWHTNNYQKHYTNQLLGTFENKKHTHLLKILFCYFISANLPDVHVIIKHHKGFRFFLSVIDIHNKYAWVVPLRYYNC